MFKTVCDMSAITRRRQVLHGRTTNRVWSHHHSCVVAPPVIRDYVSSSRTISSSTSHKLFRLFARPNGDASHDLHLQSLATIGGTCVAFEGFVLYAGGDYTLYPNIMLLVQVVAYVMSGMCVADKVRHWTCAPESGPLIGSHDSAGAGKTALPEIEFNLEFLKRQDVFVNMGIHQDNVNC